MSFQEHKITEYAASIAALPDKIENLAEGLKKQFDPNGIMNTGTIYPIEK